MALIGLFVRTYPYLRSAIFILKKLNVVQCKGSQKNQNEHHLIELSRQNLLNLSHPFLIDRKRHGLIGGTSFP